MVPQFVKLAVVMFVELFTIPSIKARVRSIEREEGGGIGKGRIRGIHEGNVTRRGRGERRFSVRMSLIKVSNHALCIHHMFFQFPCVSSWGNPFHLIRNPFCPASRQTFFTSSTSCSSFLSMISGGGQGLVSFGLEIVVHALV